MVERRGVTPHRDALAARPTTASLPETSDIVTFSGGGNFMTRDLPRPWTEIVKDAKRTNADLGKRFGNRTIGIPGGIPDPK